MMGRPPKPTVLKRMAGNPGKRPLNEFEPQSEVVKLHAPRYLTPAEKAIFREVVGILYPMGLVTKADRHAITAYSRSWARYLEAGEKVKTTTMVLKDAKNRPVNNPYLRIEKVSREQAERFWQEFGMTAVSRSRIQVEPKEEMSLAEMLFSEVDIDD